MRRLWLVVSIVLLAACSSNGDDEATTTTATSITTTTAATTTAVDTTTTAAEAVDICRGRAEMWEADQTYVADCFVVPMSFDVGVDRWRSRAGEDAILVSWSDQNSDLGVNVGFGVVSPAAEDLRMRLEAILSSDGVSAVGEIEAVTVAGADALAVDVEGAPVEELTGREVTTAECARSDSVLFLIEEAYLLAGPYQSLGGTAIQPAFFGVGACQTARVWVLQVHGHPITVVGGTVDPERHDEAVAKIEELFEGMSFEVSGS